MSTILGDLIDSFRPLLSSFTGVLNCDSLGPWYFLLALRAVALSFSNNPWDTMREDVTCNWMDSTNERSQEFCTALCYNLHFLVSVTTIWGLVFLVLLFIVGLMRLTHPTKKKKEDKDKRVAIVATESRGENHDISTVHMVAHSDHPGHYYDYPPHSYHSQYPHDHYSYHTDWHDWADWHGTPGAPMAEGHGNDVGVIPHNVGGYSIPAHQEHISQTKIPDHCYDTAQHKMCVYPKDFKQTKIPTHGSGRDQFGMCASPCQVRQACAIPSYAEKGQYHAPTKCIPVPIHGSPHKSKTVSTGNEHDETFQRRYIDPDIGARYVGQSQMVPRNCEGGQYTMASKCRPDTEGSMGNIAIGDDNANMAIKRRAVQGSEMHSKQQMNFDATNRSNMGFDSNMYTQPRMAKDSKCRPIGGKKIMTRPSMVTGPTVCCHGDATCTCTDTNSCHLTPHWEPHCTPCYSAESIHHDGHRPGENTPGSLKKAKKSFIKIFGVPLFDILVGLLLAIETCFLCTLLLFQLPTVTRKSWICSPGAAGCSPTAECTMRGRAEKRVAIWEMALTSILFIITCSGYFNLRIFWNKRCRQRCSRNEEGRGEEVCATPIETRSQDEEEGGNRENK